MKKTARKKIVLLDAHAIIHRAYHGMPNFQTRAGVPTGAIYGFASMILRIIDDFSPDHVVACYDLPKPTFRHEAFDGYKGKRSETDNELKAQFPATRELCDIFAIPIYDAEGFEADDILGTICEQLKDEEIDIIIASGDMDTLQLVDGDRVSVYTLKRGNDTVLYNEEAVIDRFSFPPKSIIDYKALRGDSSDNIPGIRGIGDKAATIAINHFHTIEELYKVLEQDEQKLLDSGLTKRMVSLIREGKDDAEFSKILATIRLDAPIDFKLPRDHWVDALDMEKAEEFFQRYELRSLVRRLEESRNTKKSKIQEEILEVADEQEPEKLNEQELKETFIALSLLDSDYAGADLEKLYEFSGKQNFKEAREFILFELQKDEKSLRLYKELEKPLYPVVRTMEENGICVDVDFLKKLSKDYHRELKKIEEKIYLLSREEFNIRSPKQLSEILFQKMGISAKGVKKSKTGTYSTNITVLEKLKGEHEIIDLIIDHRELQKLLSTYIDVLPDMVEQDGRLHAEFLQYGTATGRFSSQNPNMQNIPTRSDLGRKIREAFVAPSGKVLISFDYSQIELRILALLSGDKELIEIFKQGQDIHSGVAARVAGIKEEEVDRELRRKAKIINFGILYGMGINALRKEMDAERDEAQMFYNAFFENFKRATAFLEESKDHARKHGYTETLFGRKRYFRSINASLPFIRAMAERMALNAPIQGTAADIIKLAMLHAEREIIPQFKSAKLILQIHDEIIYEIDENERSSFEQLMLDLMESILDKSFLRYKSEVPLVVHSSHGKHWGELK